MNAHDVEKARLEVARELRLRGLDPEKYPYRYNVMRGLYPLQGLMFLDYSLSGLWVHAYNRDPRKLWKIIVQVVESPTPENDFKEVLRDRVAAEFDFELETKSEDEYERVS